LLAPSDWVLFSWGSGTFKLERSPAQIRSALQTDMSASMARRPSRRPAPPRDRGILSVGDVRSRRRVAPSLPRSLARRDDLPHSLPGVSTGRSLDHPAEGQSPGCVHRQSSPMRANGDDELGAACPSVPGASSRCRWKGAGDIGVATDRPSEATWADGHAGDRALGAVATNVPTIVSARSQCRLICRRRLSADILVDASPSLPTASNGPATDPRRNNGKNRRTSNSAHSHGLPRGTPKFLTCPWRCATFRPLLTRFFVGLARLESPSEPAGSGTSMRNS
jgi:hypothetical protein